MAGRGGRRRRRSGVLAAQRLPVRCCVTAALAIALVGVADSATIASLAPLYETAFDEAPSQPKAWQATQTGGATPRPGRPVLFQPGTLPGGGTGFIVSGASGVLTVSRLPIAGREGVRVVVSMSGEAATDMTVDGSSWQPLTLSKGLGTTIYESRQFDGRRLSLRITFTRSPQPLAVLAVAVYSLAKLPPLRPLALYQSGFAGEVGLGFLASQLNTVGANWSVNLQRVTTLAPDSALVVVDPPPTGNPYLEAMKMSNPAYWLSPGVAINAAGSVQLSLDVSVAALRGQAPNDMLTAEYRLDNGPYQTFFKMAWGTVDCYQWCKQSPLPPALKCICGAHQITTTVAVSTASTLQVRIGMKCQLAGRLQLDNVVVSGSLRPPSSPTTPTAPTSAARASTPPGSAAPSSTTRAPDLFDHPLYFDAVYEDTVPTAAAARAFVAAVRDAINGAPSAAVVVASSDIALAPGSIVATVSVAGLPALASLRLAVDRGEVAVVAAAGSAPLLASNSPVPRDCRLAWDAWGACSASCGPGSAARSEFVATFAEQGGMPCPPLKTETRPCNVAPCPTAEATTAPAPPATTPAPAVAASTKDSSNVGAIVGVSVLVVLLVLAAIGARYYRYYKRSSGERIVPVSVTTLSYMHRASYNSLRKDRAVQWNSEGRDEPEDSNLTPAGVMARGADRSSKTHAHLETRFDRPLLSSDDGPDRPEIYEAKPCAHGQRAEQKVYSDPATQAAEDEVQSVYVMPTRPGGALGIGSARQAVLYTHPEESEPPPPSSANIEAFLRAL